MRGLWIFLAMLLALAASVLPAAADKRVALVVGNGAYEHADKLANPVTDARALRNALKKVGFADSDIVYGENLNKRDLERAIGTFAGLAHDADVALAYYAGHGATFGDTPYIVPIDARFESIDQMPYELEPLENMIGELRKAKGVRIAIVDACRDNGAEQSLKRNNARGGEISRGLAPPRNPDGLILAYATQYLSTAADGPEGGDSPFTAALLKHLSTPGLDVKDLFYKVGQDVLAATKGKQRPEVKISFFDDYALVKVTVVINNTTAKEPPVDFSLEQKELNIALQASTPAALESFLAKFPTGPLSDIARREYDRQKLAALPPPSPLTVAPARLVVKQIQQAESLDASGRIRVEAAVIHVLACAGPGENEGQFYIYQYVKRSGFRAVQPPDWGHAIGGGDFATFEEATSAACLKVTLGPRPLKLEAGIDRSGSDYRNFDLVATDPNLCADACARDAKCRAFTYVNRGVQGPSARCWLKGSVPAAAANPCCTSGVK